MAYVPFPNPVDYALGVHWDSADEYYPGCEGCDPDHEYYDDSEYCRCLDLSMVQVDEATINVRRVLTGVLNLGDRRMSEVPDALIDAVIRDLRLDEAVSYRVNVAPGYYGDEAEVAFADFDAVSERIHRYYRDDHPVDIRQDEHGVLQYVRNKGGDTHGLEPIEALYAQLLEEHGNSVDPLLHRCKKLDVQKVPTAQVVWDAQKYVSTSPKCPQSPVPETPVFWGVVIEDPSDPGFFRLVDGYARVKYANSRKGNYIVLSWD